MKKIVMKFGGAALKTPKHIMEIAEIIIERSLHFDHIVIVVSAMGKMTDELQSLAYQISSSPSKREQDMLLSVGERISMALLSMALSEKKREAISLTGSQSGIITSSHYGDAKIIAVKPSRIVEYLNQGKIVIVAGFQGVSEEKEITTIGRGGSDTTAVALGIALQAEKVEFYKDVQGVYSEDPKKKPGLLPFSQLTFKEALDLAHQNSFILHPRSIFLASKNGLPLHVVSFKKEERDLFAGTWILDDKILRSCIPIYEDKTE